MRPYLGQKLACAEINLRERRHLLLTVISDLLCMACMLESQPARRQHRESYLRVSVARARTMYLANIYQQSQWREYKPAKHLLLLSISQASKRPTIAGTALLSSIIEKRKLSLRGGSGVKPCGRCAQCWPRIDAQINSSKFDRRALFAHRAPISSSIYRSVLKRREMAYNIAMKRKLTLKWQAGNGAEMRMRNPQAVSRKLISLLKHTFLLLYINNLIFKCDFCFSSRHVLMVAMLSGGSTFIMAYFLLAASIPCQSRKWLILRGHHLLVS